MIRAAVLLVPCLLALSSCMGLRATKHTYASGPSADVGGARVRLGFRPEGTKGPSFMMSAMVVGGGVATLDGPFRWRVEALGETGRHESLVVHRIRTRTSKTGRDEWFPAGELGRRAEFRALKGKEGVVRARYPIPGLLKVIPEEDGALDVWVDVAVSGPEGTRRKTLQFRMDPTVKSQNEVVFLPVEIARSIGTDPADWEDSMWD
ncbi:hypothetical protein HAHE_39900 [Haloferula helveola]|uniref:Lipoprotein n=1 Tax=Haloferula helveola TaxID=490095 RepID=A0ABM7RIS4_9BACT|nr:hypothetical protein HAHE_39900 [Haloferula helveola]